MRLALGPERLRWDGEIKHTREGVAANKLLRNLELTAELADLVLEEFAQRLNKLQTVASHETLGNSADIVVGLDGLGRSLERDTLDDI